MFAHEWVLVDENVTRRVAEMFRGRVLVVHNAPFEFLAEEFVVVAAIDGVVTCGELGAVEVTVGPGDGERVPVQATLDAGTTECTMLLAEVYRREGRWRLRVVGQGHDSGCTGRRAVSASTSRTDRRGDRRPHQDVRGNAG
jgi:DNA polymerase-3 subunit epsilon